MDSTMSYIRHLLYQLCCSGALKWAISTSTKDTRWNDRLLKVIEKLMVIDDNDRDVLYLRRLLAAFSKSKLRSRASISCLLFFDALRLVWRFPLRDPGVSATSRRKTLSDAILSILSTNRPTRSKASKKSKQEMDARDLSLLFEKAAKSLRK